MKKLLTLAAGTLLFLSSCATRVNYIGRTYNPTTDVELFFNTNDVPKKFEVIGKIQGENYGFRNFERLQTKIVEEAKKHGADAIIISGMGDQFLGSEKKTTTETKGTTTTSTTTRADATVPTITADFIKYK
ncbi:hypothetical protein [Pedobacter duraquae]|uniref:Heavy-metal-binding protein n=1 Tax=Pedobacter duraquae TaxID=425511 RepID=A0A4R6IAX0_9SPHI|nr:hypothetical protein [Pedobacter duraquae]TDO19052.1 hypothetical protein CLV32_4674 [Pedobacter duraquae]